MNTIIEYIQAVERYKFLQEVVNNEGDDLEFPSKARQELWRAELDVKTLFAESVRQSIR